MEQDRSEPAKRSWAAEPTQKEVLVLTGVCYLVYLAVIVVLGNYWAIVRAFGDNQAYVSIADGIRSWNFASIQAWQFFGLPYAMVAFSFLTHTSFWTALLAISIVGSFVAIVLSNRLWGGWVAGLFAVVSRDWMERSLLGGAEPLFLVLVFGCFLAVRRQRWLLAALFASLAAVVRPMGIFALAAIGTVLLFRKQFKTLAAAGLIAIVVGGLYVVPLRVYQGSSLANVKAYGQADGSDGKEVTYPFVALIRRPAAVGPVTGPADVLAGNATKLNLARTALWVGIVVLGVVTMFRSRQFRDFARTHAVEILFCALYTGLLFTYNSPWARVAFPRYAIPIIPFLILAFEPWIPKDRRLLWGFGVFSALLAAAETGGILKFFQIMHRTL